MKELKIENIKVNSLLSNSKFPAISLEQRRICFIIGVMHSRNVAAAHVSSHGNRVNLDRHCCTSKLSARSTCTTAPRATTTGQFLVGKARFRSITLLKQVIYRGRRDATESTTFFFSQNILIQ